MADGLTVDTLMITHNRPHYTALALKALLDTCEQSMRVWVWHNGDDAATMNVVSSFRGHPRLYKLRVSERNVGLREPTNWFWQHAAAPYVAKVDDDCIVQSGWASALVEAHERQPQLGIVACWHFYDDDFVPELAAPKVRELSGGQRLMLNCWVQGSGYVMRRRVFEQLGPLKKAETFTDYCIRASAAGWINGWPLPLIHIEHMDDPRSEYTRFGSEEEFVRNRPLTAINHRVHTLAEWRNHAHWIARSLQQAPYNPRLYAGWRAKLRRGVVRLKRGAGWQEPWRLSSNGRPPGDL
jgi:GT2 family glycosyltransferase